MTKKAASLAASITIIIAAFTIPLPGFVLEGKINDESGGPPARLFVMEQYKINVSRQTESMSEVKEPSPFLQGESYPAEEPETDIPHTQPAHSNNSVSTEEADTSKESFSDSGKIIDYRPDYSVNKKPRYPVAAKRMGQQGSVCLLVTTDASGRAAAVRIESSSGFILLDNAALAAARKWTFPAATNAGSISFRATITFRLEEGS